MNSSQSIKQNDICYYIIGPLGNRQIIPCLVNTIYRNHIYLDKLIPKDNRLINNIPINQFQPTPWTPLPEHFTHTSVLYTTSYATSEPFVISLSDKVAIKKALSIGTMIRAVDKLHYIPDIQIDNLKRYRIILKYDNSTQWHDYTFLAENPSQLLFPSYQAASFAVSHESYELMISNKDWSIKQIDNVLNHWAKMRHQDLKPYREYILALPNVEDIIVRIHNVDLEWKYKSMPDDEWNPIIL